MSGLVEGNHGGVPLRVMRRRSLEMWLSIEETQIPGISQMNTQVAPRCDEQIAGNIH